MGILVKIIITLFGAILIFSDLKENHVLLMSFWIVILLYMIFESFFKKKKDD